MDWENGEVDVNVELKLLTDDVVSSQRHGDEAIPRDEEMLALA